MSEHYDLENIRTLLVNGFTDEEIRQLCYDTPDFRPVYDHLAQNAGKAEIVHRLVEHIDRKELQEPLLAWAKKCNPVKYGKYAPYYISIDEKLRKQNSTHGGLAEKSKKVSTQMLAAIISATLCILFVCTLSVAGTMWKFFPTSLATDVTNIAQATPPSRLPEPNFALAYYNKGLDYVASKDFEKAINEFKKAIELDPNYAEAYYQLGVIYGNSGDLQQAFSLLNKAIEIKPDLADAYYNRALVHGKTDDFDQAITDFNKAIELDPTYELAYFYRGVAYRELGNFRKALLDFDKVIELNPNSAQGYLDRGVTHFNMGATEKALPDFDKAIELEPTNALAYENRGFTQIKVGNLEQALSDLEQYLKLSPSDSSDREEVLNTIAQLKSELGK